MMYSMYQIKHNSANNVKLHLCIIFWVENTRIYVSCNVAFPAQFLGKTMHKFLICLEFYIVKSYLNYRNICLCYSSITFSIALLILVSSKL